MLKDFEWYDYLAVILFLAVLINTISLTSAFWVDETFIKNDSLINEKLLEGGDVKTNYGTYIIEESKWWDILGIWTKEKVKEISLINNTEKCINCFSDGTIILYKDDVLIEDVLWKRSFDGEKTWVDWNSYKNWKILVEVDKDVYETKCREEEKFDEINQTEYKQEVCEQIKIGTEKTFEPLKLGEVYPAGSYRYRLEGSKKPEVIYDWQLKTSGKILNEWAIWGNISEGAEAEVTLNSPADNSIQYNNSIVLTSSANITSGAYLVNATLYDNSTGSWEARETNFISFNITGLISYYTLDETSGTTAYDSFGSYHGTLYNGVLINQDGKINKAYRFDGVDDYVRLPSMTFGGNVTISGWAYVYSHRNYQRLVDLGNGANSDNIVFMLSEAGSGKPNFDFYNGNSLVASITSPNAISLNKWYHLVGVVDGSKIKLYINGTKVAEANSPSVNNVTRTSNFIGKSNWGEYTNATIDEVSIWDRALTQQEIQQLYNNGAGIRVTNTTTTTSFFTKNYPAGSNVLWNVKYCDSDGDCGFAIQNRTFFIDNIAPNISLNYPTALIDYGRNNGTLQLNITAEDVNLDKLWYNYNGTNITIEGALSGVYNLTNITLIEKRNITIYANDTAGNLKIENFEWNYMVFENNLIYNSTSYETKNESFILNLSLNNQSLLTRYWLVLNEIYYTINQGKVTINHELVNADINRSFYFVYEYNNTNITSDERKVLVKNFLVNDTGAKKYANIYIKDEYDNSLINSTTIDFLNEYYIDGGGFKQTFEKINVADGVYYIYGTPNIQYFFMDGRFYYYATGYQPRYRFLDKESFANSTEKNITLYLLLLSDGILVRYGVYDETGNKISGARITAYKIVGSTQVLVEQTETDEEGQASLFLNPNYYHKIIVSANGCDTKESQRRVTTSDVFNVFLSCASGGEETTEEIIRYNFIPSEGILKTNEEREFGANVSGKNCFLEGIRYRLVKSGNSLIDLSSSNACGDTIKQNLNLTNLEGSLTAYLSITIDGKTTTYMQNYKVIKIENISWQGTNITYLLDKISDPSFGLDMGLSQKSKLLLSLLLIFSLISLASAIEGVKMNGLGIMVFSTAIVFILSLINFLNLGIESENSAVLLFSKYGIFFITSIATAIALIKGGWNS
ncbi:MAG: LamG domain-containing protein [Candidatus Omnitrophica bacterium]|nr:LamG domain-containing protein [Candidatus Omnitrophota bacterium]